jgi:acyl dehydratase
MSPAAAAPGHGPAAAATGVDLSAVGTSSDPYHVSWTAEQAILYALGVGAGQDDPLLELHLTTQNCEGVTQQVLPTYAVVLGQTGLGRRLPFGRYDRGALVHAAQALEVYRPLPAAGEARLVARLEGIYDKGSGALVEMAVEAADPLSAEPLWASRLSYFVRGSGGFGGDRGPTTDWHQPLAEPDEVLAVRTRADQALLYRLSGDLNPLHVDPSFAGRAGFSRPILHGLCTYGFAVRVLARHLCGGDQGRVRAVNARFSKPACPGEELKLHVWRRQVGPSGRSEAAFLAFGGVGRTVLDRGTFSYV